MPQPPELRKTTIVHGSTSAGEGEAREERSRNLAATVLASVGLAACSSGGEGGEASGAVVFCGGGTESPVSLERGATCRPFSLDNTTLT
jgi:hypothetical protein